MKKHLIDVEIELLQDQLGTVPKSKEVYTKYVATKVSEAQAQEEAEGIKEDLEETGWTTFMEDEQGLYILNYMILGFMRDAGNNLKEQLTIKNIRSKLENFLFVEPRNIRFYRDGEVLKQADGVLERPLRAQTPQGPRVALAKSDLVKAGTRLKFRLVLVDHKEIKVNTLKEILEYGELRGLGQFRNGSYGQFKLISFEEVEG